MTKIDINGNVISTNRTYLLGVLRNIGLKNYDIDSVGRVMIHTADGGMITWFQEEEPQLNKRLGL